MQTFPECLNCIQKQSLAAISLTNASDEKKALALHQVMWVLEHTDRSFSPAHLVTLTNQIICDVTGVEDPYLMLRLNGREQALSILPPLQALIDEASDPFETATRLAIAGNIIDVIPGQMYDLWAVVQQALEQPIAGDGLETFRAAVGSAASILYLADNAGESAFDRFLVEQMDRPVTYAVKSGPILNDATYEDALVAGLDKVAKVIRTGSQGPGTILPTCSPEFLDIYKSADLVIAKGQANYETLDNQGQRVFFLMKVKCPIIGREIDARVGELLIRRGTPLTQQ